MTDWQKISSSAVQRPAELDTTSSQFTVYERRNIQQVTEMDSTTNQPYTHWTYEERTYTKEEYANLTNPAFQLLMQDLSDLEVEMISMNLEV